MEIRDFWLDILKTLETELGHNPVELWLKPIKPLMIDGDTIKLEVPDQMVYKNVKERYEDNIIRAAKNICGKTFALHYSLSLNSSDATPVAKPEAKADIAETPSFSVSRATTKAPAFAFNPNYTFETFIEGASNRFAYASAVAVAKGPGKSNPFFIYSSPGLGKTHLLHGIANEIFKNKPNANIIYTASETFVNEYIDAVQNKVPESFRNKYRKLDCLLLDDIQFLVGKDRSEEEFFNTFNSLFDSRKQIVITSDRSPKELALSDRLVSRFLSGLSVDIKMPDLETRIAILRQKKELHKFVIPDEVITFIAENVKKNIRELEGCLITVGNYFVAVKVQPTIDMVKDLIKDHIVPGDQDGNRISIDLIKNAVSEKFSMDIKDFKSPRKTAALALPRQIAMYLACTLTELSLPEIGAAFNRDHTTVMFARDKIKQKLVSDPYFSEMVNKLIGTVKAVNN